MNIPFIDLKQQYKSLKKEINNRIKKVLEHGQYIMGPEVVELETRLAKFTGSKYCITVSSGTEALLISLMSLDIKPGDEIITSPFSFVSTAEVIAILKAKPVFVDIELDTCNINAELIEKKITKKTKAIISVSLFGQTSDMEKINYVARRNGNIPVIEDAAQSFGATYKGIKSCNLSTIGCTSFFPSKPLGCYGDGGAIFTNQSKLAKLCRSIRLHGQNKPYHYSRVGVGGRMDTIQCAIVLAKFKQFNWEIKKRKIIGNHYNSLIDKIGISRTQQIKNRSSVFAQYTIFTDKRKKIQKGFQQFKIPTAIYYPKTINSQIPYKKFGNDIHTPNAKWASNRVLSLPMSAFLKFSDQKKITKLLKIFSYK
ncbi:DegT/DnrJ/EryC1/StrS aminotransferase family protein [Candidatus Pelagibacter bacterium]|nr:DegT/DnrJ/EryC1/StrS aminotransferase family protein [Candidatus Pelagibacter bacterium]MDA8829372.1 DegT/DnrJ/EryC1/StrS aminotransferase family protein [Candidatus Pelagibacter bacterium]